MTGSGYTFVLGSWKQDADSIRALREQVLVAELGVTRYQLEQADEGQAFHVLVSDSGGRTVGAARMQRDGRIDYVVVLRPWRRKTVGGALLSYLHHIAQAHRLEQIWCVVPETAQRFFEKNRFLPCGEWLSTVVLPGEKYLRVVQAPDVPQARH